MKNALRFTSVLLLVLAFIALPQSTTFAQDPQPPATPAGAWGEVVNADGTVRADTLTDLGVVYQDASWMPSIPGVGPVQASYHEYQTPSGNIILEPDLTTYVFMALSPNESGLNDAASSLSMNGIVNGGAATDLALLLSQGPGGYAETISQMGFASPNEFFNAVASGQTNLFTLPGWQSFTFLSQLLTQSYKDSNVYTAMLLYTPGQCAQLPGGCPPQIQTQITAQAPVPAACPPEDIQVGRITVSALKTAPNYALVVGQDDGKRGADVMWEVRVYPTIDTRYSQEPVMACEPSGAGESADCTQENGRKGTYHLVGWNCVPGITVYRESLNRVSASASLASTSRDWILNELSIRYPGAYLHHPDFGWSGNPGTGTWEGDVYVWRFSQVSVPFADPGYFDLGASGLTSGTPVSQPRGFTLGGGRLEVYLKEIAIIQ